MQDLGGMLAADSIATVNASVQREIATFDVDMDSYFYSYQRVHPHVIDTEQNATDQIREVWQQREVDKISEGRSSVLSSILHRANIDQSVEFVPDR